MPWAEKDMNIVLHEADDARLSLPLCGSIKEVIKGIKIERGLGDPQGPARPIGRHTCSDGASASAISARP